MHSLAIENSSPSILVSHMYILRDFDQISLWDYWWEIKFILHYYCRLSVQNYWLPNACKPTCARNRCIVGTREVQLDGSPRRRRVVTVRPARDAQPTPPYVTHLGGWACSYFDRWRDRHPCRTPYARFFRVYNCYEYSTVSSYGSEYTVKEQRKRKEADKRAKKKKSSPVLLTSAICLWFCSD
jgi:hypothetical protein